MQTLAGESAGPTATGARSEERLAQHIQQSLRTKRMLLFKEMLQASAYPEDMLAGFNLSGSTDTPSGWRPDFRPAVISEADLMELSDDINSETFREVAANMAHVEELL